jgi:uncharacterized membrane protein YraQ (UPF0718 family)
MIDAVIHALGMALAMGWEILWPLILGFALSAVVQAAVSKQQMSWLLPDDRPRSIATALALGAASSSCSYAAVALARTIFRKGGHFTAAMAFEMASTNLVVELGLIMLVLLGWQFTLALMTVPTDKPTPPALRGLSRQRFSALSGGRRVDVHLDQHQVTLPRRVTRRLL